MLRVWGGGVFLPEEFYSACDEAGIMVYHDMMCVPHPAPHAAFNDSM
jgi:beta-mannosidase